MDDPIEDILLQDRKKRRKVKSPLALIVKSVLALMLPLLVALLTLPGPGGEPVLSLNDLSPKKWLGQRGDEWLQALPSSNEVTLYRWQDEQGRWHFSEEKPTHTALFETVTVSGPVNSLPADSGEAGNGSKRSTGFLSLSDQVENTGDVTSGYVSGPEKE